MVERPFDRSDDDLANSLRSLGQQVRYPETPDLMLGVVRGISTESRSPVRTLPVRRMLAVAAALLLLLVGSALAYPETRSTVAGWFNVPGITLFYEDEPVDAPVYGAPLGIGSPVTLDEARDGAGFDLLMPDIDFLGEPDEVYLRTLSTDALVSFVYHADERIPETEQTGVGILLTQFVGNLHQGMYGKGTPDGVTVEHLELNGLTAYWVSGEPHTFYWSSDTGSVGQDRIRMAGNTLLWQHGTITLRLESALDRDTVLQIAESIR